MVSRKDILSVIDNYRLDDITVGTIGSHSALEIMDGCKDEGLKTLCICVRGRETPYKRFNRLSDRLVILDSFDQILLKEYQQILQDQNTILVANRAFSAYLGYDDIENNLFIPIFGSRYLLRAEERTSSVSQYELLKRAKIRHPIIYEKPEEINRLSIVKVQEQSRKLERAFFLVSSYEDYLKKSKDKIKKGIINENELKRAKIEEYVIGTYFNFNFFYSPVKDETEFLGIERRLQTNIHDFTTSIPAREQLELNIELQNIEIGHTPASIRESLLEKVFEIGDKFTNVTKRIMPPGIIGPFSLQSVITPDLEIIVYDVSLRVPGNPILATTSPYTKYYYGQTFGVGRRIAMEIKNAIGNKQIDSILT